MKPFIKPRSSASEPAPPPAGSRISPNELTVFGLASTLTDPVERAAYLDRACLGDATLRARIEERLAAKSAPVSAIQTAVQLRDTLPVNPARPDALALVPMSAMQFAAAQQPPRHSPVPWAAATILAIAVGALAVFFFTEKKSRELAEETARSATTAQAAADQEREAALATALEAKTVAGRSEQQRLEADRQREAAAAEAKQAREQATAIRAETDKTLAATKATTQAATAEVTRLRTETAAERKAGAIVLADSLAKLAALQLDARNYAEAEANARRCLELRTAAGADGWSLVEARSLLGAALLQRNQDAAALQELTAAAIAAEALGKPATETERARLTAASKRIVQFFNITGRRKEATDWRRRLEASGADSVGAPTAIHFSHRCTQMKH